MEPLQASLTLKREKYMFLIYLICSLFLSANLYAEVPIKNNYCYISVGANYSELESSNITEQVGLGFRLFFDPERLFDMVDCRVSYCDIRRYHERHHMLFFPTFTLFKHTSFHKPFYIGSGLSLISLDSQLGITEYIGGYPLKIYEEQRRVTLQPVMSLGYELQRTNKVLSFVQIDLFYPEEFLYCKNYMAVCTFNVGF
jgi:hypothetical protein